MINSIKDQATNIMQWMASGSKLTYAAVAVGLVVAFILFRFFFKSVAGVFHSIGFSFGSGGNPTVAAEPGLASSSRMKLLLMALVPAGCGYAAYIFLPRFLPTIFQ
jgi:hypothetical protein